MAFEKRSMVVFLTMLLGFCGVCMGAVYKVGDSSGWTESGKVDYKNWSASKTFQVGDTIVFQYDNRFSNVIRVSHKDYNACNNIHSYFSRNSGNDSFVIPKTGHYFFISGLPGHCEAGQRVDIRVSKDTATLVPAPAHAPKAHRITPSATPQAHAPKAHRITPSATPQAHAPKAHGMSPLGSPAPSAKKHNGAVSISGIWLAVVVAICVSFYGFGY